MPLIVEDDLGDIENLTHGLCTGETMSERWEIHPDDPLSARAVHVWEQRLSRGDWAVRTTGRDRDDRRPPPICGCRPG